MSTDSPTNPRSLEEIRSDHLGVEDGLASFRSLIRCASIFTGLWGLMLVLETFTGAHGTERYPHSWLPKFIFVPEEVTSWHSGIGAGLAFALYYLMKYATNALKPGAGMRHARLAGGVVLTAIGVFGPICVWFFCIGPAITLLNPRSGTVLAARYREVLEATPFVSDSNRRKYERDSKILRWLVVGCAALVLLAFAFA